jgi:hypothetical protein
MRSGLSARTLPRTLEDIVTTAHIIVTFGPDGEPSSTRVMVDRAAAALVEYRRNRGHARLTGVALWRADIRDGHINEDVAALRRVISKTWGAVTPDWRAALRLPFDVRRVANYVHRPRPETQTEPADGVPYEDDPWEGYHLYAR